MAKTYIKELQEQIEKLNDGFEAKEVEIWLLENELQDTVSPYKLLSEQTGFLLEMMTELLAFEKKNPSDRIKASKGRLLKLLHINTELNGIVNYNNTLKTCNRQLLGKIQMLRVKNNEMNMELMKISRSHNF